MHHKLSDAGKFRMSQTETTARAHPDWDEAVRSAFIDQCLRAGIRAERIRESLRERAKPSGSRTMRDKGKNAELQAALGWLRLETCLARYGELAALALSRYVEEATLAVRVCRLHRPRRECDERRNSRLPATVSERDSGVVRLESALALSIIERARARLERFWELNRAA
jgi:hypothetical protein